MAVNVTEKDKTLNEIIDWCEQLAVEGLRLASALLMAVKSIQASTHLSN